MTEISKAFLQSAGRHFVNLSCVQRNPGSEEEYIQVISGFVVEVLGQWVFITAGHVLQEVKDALAADAEFDIWRLGDQTAGNRFEGKGIPFDFNIDEWLVIDDDERGVDYAATPLKEIFVLALKKGGISPLTQRHCGNPRDDRNRLLLVGIPFESVAYDGVSSIQARIALAPMTRCEAPKEARKKSENQIYARLDDDPNEVIASLKGMSGGPVFAYEIADSTLCYQVIGVQSSWYKRSRIVAVCPILSFVTAIEEAVREAIQEAADRD